MQELRNQQIHPRNVAKAVSEGIIEKLNPVSITSKLSMDEHSSFADVCNSTKSGYLSYFCCCIL